MSEAEAQFISLGNHLKYVREQAKESLAEVSGAVEIDENYLERIEAGLERPAEDILLLLISHFGVKDHEAVQLWESADYDTSLPEEIRLEQEVVQLTDKPVVMVVPGDSRAVYSDGVEIIATQGGVTVNFTHNQKNGTVTPVARVGMSPQQAELLLSSLQTAMLHIRYNNGTKLLPPTAPTEEPL